MGSPAQTAGVCGVFVMKKSSNLVQSAMYAKYILKQGRVVNGHNELKSEQNLTEISKTAPPLFNPNNSSDIRNCACKTKGSWLRTAGRRCHVLQYWLSLHNDGKYGHRLLSRTRPRHPSKYMVKNDIGFLMDMNHPVAGCVVTIS